MPFDFQPTLKGKLIELRPLRSEHFIALFRCLYLDYEGILGRGINHRQARLK
jgi:hypothetical protein